jgi:hypothetical protein
MQTNKWQAFLSDQELIEEYHHLLNGKYLFGKVCHDALECLNNYLSVLSLMNSDDVEISHHLLDWFSSKKGVVETAVAEITSLAGASNRAISSDEWPNLIKQVSLKLSGVQTLANDFQRVDNALQDTEKELVAMAMANLKGVQALFADIQTESYEKLLTTRKYQTYDS